MNFTLVSQVFCFSLTDEQCRSRKVVDFTVKQRMVAGNPIITGWCIPFLFIQPADK